MEQVVTQLAATHDVDLSQKGATLNLDVPDQHQQWMISNVDGRVGVTRCLVDQENGLAPDIDLVFEVKPEGWEPVEVVHTEAAWQTYGKNIPIEGQGDFNFATFADMVAQDLEQKTSTVKTTGVVFDMQQQKSQEQTAFAGSRQETEAKPLMITVAEAAEVLGITPKGVHRIIGTGKVKAENRQITEVIKRTVEKTYVNIDDLLQYRQTYGKMGRPKKSS